MKNEPECLESDPKIPIQLQPPKKTYGDFRPKLAGKPGNGYTVVSVAAMI